MPNVGAIALPAAKSESRATSIPITVARVMLVSTLVAAPLVFGAVQTWAWAGLGVVAAVLMILWAVGCVQQGEITIHWSALYVPAVLFLLLGVAQLVGHLTLDSFETWEALIKLATDLVFFFLAGQLWAGASSRTWKRFGFAVVIYAFAISLFAIVEFFTSRGLLYWTTRTNGDIFGPYVNHNDYAGLMEMLIPIGICYAFSRSLRRPNQTLLIFGLSGAVASVLLSGSRGGMISLAVEMVVLGIFLRRWKVIRNAQNWGFIGLMAVTGAAALFLSITPQSAWQRLATIAGLVRKPDVTLENRLVVSRDALRELKDYPWLGTGLGSFESVFPQYQTFSTDLAWNHAHDDYVEALTETGIVGGLIIFSALLLLVLTAFRNFPEQLKEVQGWIQLGAMLGCLGLLIHSFADFNLHIPANSVWFAVCAALATVPVGTSRSVEGMNCPAELDLDHGPAETLT